MPTGIAILEQAYQSERFTPLNKWLSEFDKYELIRKKKMAIDAREIKTLRNDLYKCPSCNRVYQLIENGRIEYLDHFPKRSGVLRTCQNCE